MIGTQHTKESTRIASTIMKTFYLYNLVLTQLEEIINKLDNIIEIEKTSEG